MSLKIMIKSVIHWIEHKTKRNTGKIVSWSDGEYIYVGFECDSCGIIDPTSIDKIEVDKVVPFVNKDVYENESE
jgi:hypothetical protein